MKRPTPSAPRLPQVVISAYHHPAAVLALKSMLAGEGIDDRGALTIDGLLWRLDVRTYFAIDGTGDVVDLFLPGPMTRARYLAIHALAPYVRQGSYLETEGPVVNGPWVGFIFDGDFAQEIVFDQ